jgi:hypothetical protein
MQEVIDATDKLWREMMDKVMLFIACCVFSFICGAYAVEMVEKGKGCTVKIGRGNVTTVFVGR